MSASDKVKSLLVAASQAENRAARLEGELEGHLTAIENIAGTRDLDKAQAYLEKMDRENEAAEKELGTKIAELEGLYERAQRGENIADEIGRGTGTDQEGPRRRTRQVRRSR